MYVYFYSLHVSGSHVPIIRRIIVSVRHLVYVTPLLLLLVCCSDVYTPDQRVRQVGYLEGEPGA